MTMEKNKKILLFHIPMSICNFRCHYCYLAQRETCYQGVQPEMKYTPEQVRAAFSRKRLGGSCFMNFCAEGETLLTKDIDAYVKALVDEGHYAEIVTNMTVTNVIERILNWDKALLRRIEFKCSFHYLELKRKGLLETFAANVKKVWAAGASANVEITPSDELIPYIDEVKAFSLAHFGALPHLTIARDDRTSGIEYLTRLSPEAYAETWSVFGSGFWEFKRSIFGRRVTDFCYAGAWSVCVDLATGRASGCYGHCPLGDVVADPTRPFPEKPVGRCPIAHCYNGHALMTMGLVPGLAKVGYGEIRDRVRADGSHWLQPELRAFFDSRLAESNAPYGCWRKGAVRVLRKAEGLARRIVRKVAGRG